MYVLCRKGRITGLDVVFGAQYFKYLLEEKQEYESARFKRYIAVSTPNCEPLDPFDADYFNQEDMLALKEETKAVLFITNQVDIHTPIHLRNGKK